VANGVYNKFKTKLADGTIDWDTTTNIKVMLVGTGYTFDAEHDFVGDIVAQESSGSGYVGGYTGAGRKAIATRTVVQVDASDRAELRTADGSVTWTAINVGAVKAAVIFHEITSDAASELIAYIDTTGFPVTTNGGDFTINWNAAGVVQLG
jgi:hypothetical protein